VFLILARLFLANQMLARSKDDKISVAELGIESSDSPSVVRKDQFCSLTSKLAGIKFEQLF
jgi:hypothetical protein